MIAVPFFPNVAFGWCFCLILLALLAVAAVWDARTLTIPKPLVALVLVVGVVLNLLRCTWLGAEGYAGAAWSLSGTWGGLVEGLTFCVAGFATGFGLFFLLWILGTCGGGDVKLFAALGAWLGPLWTLYLLVTTYFVVLVGFVLGGWLLHLWRRGLEPRRAKVAYSFPVAVGTAVLLLWVCRAELGIGDLMNSAGLPPTVQIESKNRQ